MHYNGTEPKESAQGANRRGLNSLPATPNVADPQERGLIPGRRLTLILPPLNRPHRDAENLGHVSGIRKHQATAERQPRAGALARGAGRVVASRAIGTAWPLGVEYLRVRDNWPRFRSWTFATSCRFPRTSGSVHCVSSSFSPAPRDTVSFVDPSVDEAPNDAVSFPADPAAARGMRHNVAPLEQSDKASLHDRTTTFRRLERGR